MAEKEELHCNHDAVLQIEKRHIQQGKVMPEIPNNAWGLTIWYMTE